MDKLSKKCTNLDENWQEGTFGQAARIDFVGFGFGQQGAEQLSVKGVKLGVLAVFRDFRAVTGPIRWSITHKTCESILWSAWVHLDLCPPQVCAFSV